MVVGGPHDTSPIGLGPNWVTKVGGLPAYIREIAHALIRTGHPESQAIQLAVGVVQRWAAGGGHVTAKTRAKAAAALAEWEAKKAATAAVPNRHDHTAERVRSVDLAGPDLGKRAGMIVAVEVPKGTLPVVDRAAPPHHVTLAFLGQDVTDDGWRKALRTAATVSARHAPLTGTLGGIGAFPPGPDGTPIWAPVDVPGLAELRHDVVTAHGGHASEHGWTPHVTLTYAKPGVSPPRPLRPRPVTFTHLSVHHGGQVRRFPLHGSAQFTAEEATMPVDLAFDEAKHPRAPKGSGTGGQFVTLSAGAGYKGARQQQADRVKDLQRKLNAAGAKDGNGQALKVDGLFGPKTLAALRAYQKAHGLSVDGIAGVKTFGALGAVSTSGRPVKGRVVAMSADGRFAVIDLAAGPDTATRAKLAKQGKALPGGRFPITDRASLAKAVKAVGRAKGSHDAVRRFIITRAKALNATDLIPASWNADGTISLSAEQRGRVVAAMGNPTSPRLTAALNGAAR